MWIIHCSPVQSGFHVLLVDFYSMFVTLKPRQNRKNATELSVKDDVIVAMSQSLPFTTHSKVCSFSSQQEPTLLLGRNISKQSGTQGL